MDNQTAIDYEDRENDLLFCLQYNTQCEPQLFTPGERIIINQERGALFDARARKSGDPKFRIDGELLDRVEKTLIKIYKYKWTPEKIQNI